MVDTQATTVVIAQPHVPTVPPQDWQTSSIHNTQASRSPSPIPDDQRSSSLSDFDTELDPPPPAPADDDASSQFAATENESEAETERLQDTPKPYGRFATTTTTLTPSKLNNQTARLDDSSDSDATPTNSIAGRKRKRPSPMSSKNSPLSEASDSDRALSKRLHAQPTMPTYIKNPVMASGSDSRPNGINQSQSSHDHIDPPDSPSLLNHKMRGRSRSRRARSTKGSLLPSPTQPPPTHTAGHPVGEAADDAPVADDEEDDDDEDADSAEALTVEDAEKQAQAAKAFAQIAQQFHLWRAKSQDEKIAAAEAELAELDEPDPNHLEYVRQMQCITARRDTRTRQDTLLHQYKRQALRIETIAHRSQLLSQFYQEAREVREDLLYKLGREWYIVQKERRAAQADELTRYTHVYTANRSEQLRQQARYNTEVSILAGIAKYIGFPAAPDLKGARPSEMQDDLKAMKVAVKQTAKQSVKKPHARNSVQRSEQFAQKDLIDQSTWSIPQHVTNRTPLSIGANHQPVQPFGYRAASPGQESSPIYSTPAPGEVPKPGAYADAKMSGPSTIDHDGFYSDGPSSIAAAAASTNRIPVSSTRQTAGDGSPVAPLRKRTIMSRKENQNLDAGTGKRDFSGVSSTSTIDAPAPDYEGSSYDVSKYGPPYGRMMGVPMYGNGREEDMTQTTR